MKRSPNSFLSNGVFIFLLFVIKSFSGEDDLKIEGLGNFSRVKRSARVGRNPQTGAEIKIPAKWAPVFKAGSQLKESVQKKK